jgi:hydroxymethylpyrimidine/phosphomethylpyrimidine kinase
MTPIALTIAGSDSSGGAGIQADLKTFAALRVYGASVITALTAQNTRGVEAVHVVPPDFVLAQMQAVAGDLEVGAIKIGMLATAPVIEAVAEGLKLFPGVPVVLDPVMMAQSGDVLLDENAIDTLRAVLVPLATLVTPNLAEAARLLSEPESQDERAMRAQALVLQAMTGGAVLAKGGHAKGDKAVDIYVDGDGELRLEAPRTATNNTHGTGCTLSSAIAAELAKGAPLRDAVARGKVFVTAAIEHSEALKIGHGRGPVHHMQFLWD